MGVGVKLAAEAFDLADAIVSCALPAGCRYADKRFGWEGRYWRTLLLVILFCVIFALNLSWLVWRSFNTKAVFA